MLDYSLYVPSFLVMDVVRAPGNPAQSLFKTQKLE